MLFSGSVEFLTMSITINLPTINGALEAGLAVGTDVSLADDAKLPICSAASLGDAVKQAAVWAYTKFAGSPQEVLEMYVSGAAICIQGALCRMIGVSLDGDWKEAGANIAGLSVPADVGPIQAMISSTNYQRALTIIVATRANWWLTNHHTGQGECQGYTRKVLVSFFGQGFTKAHVDMAHTIGHWASTIHVLGLADITGLRAVGGPLHPNPIPISLSTDAKMRFTSMPAGTHRLVIAYEAAKRLVKSPIAAYCPEVEAFATIPATRSTVLARLSAHHIGASYLTGAPRADYADTSNEIFLGRLGTYIQALFPRSTLAASPHISKQKVESYEDYSAEWANILQQFKTLAITSGNAAIQALTQATQAGADITNVRAAFQ